ncbi:MAG: hypothetical protein HFJ29_09635 [Clostridia bacterium]|nr:hypothetical protein [Clostridia bacterium]
MLHYYSSQNERTRFIKRLEELIVEGFGTKKRVKIDGVREEQIVDLLDKEAKKTTFFMSKEEKERVQKEQKEAEERHIKALGMLKDASKLNKAIVADVEKILKNT